MEYERDIVTLLLRFLRSAKRHWMLLLALCLLGGGGNFLWEKSTYKPVYEARAVVSVSYNGEEILSNSFDYDANTAKRAEEAFRNLLETELMEQLLLANLGTERVNGTISASPLAGSNTLAMEVQSPSPRDAYEILWAAITVYPQVAVYDSPAFQMLLRQKPTVPDAPVNRFKGTEALINGSLLGLAAGSLLLAVMTAAKNPVSGAQDVKELLEIPLLAEIPHISRKSREEGNWSAPFRRLRQLLSQGEQVIGVTSTLPGEGKSTIAANLALSLAAEGQRVVLVDGDLWEQTLHRQLGCEPSRYNLMDLLQDPGLDPCKHLTMVGETGLRVLSGPDVSTRFCWVEDAPMARVLDKLKRTFDYVVLDCPCADIGSQTPHLARQTHCLLYVIRRDGPEKRWIRQGIEALRARGLPVRGCVLNCAARKD